MLYVSIILPTYNRAHCINNAIDSVRAQWYDDWELIVVDDGSADNTKGIVEGYNDDRIHYVYKENGGSASARNVGLTHASGDVIMYLDSDDVYFSEAVSFVVNAFEKNPKGVFGIGNQLRRIMLMNAEREILIERNPAVLHQQSVTLQDIYYWNVKFCGSSIFHTRVAIESGFVWDTDVPFFEDWDFILSIAKKIPSGFVYIPELMCEYRLQYGSDSLNSKADYQDLADGFASIYKKHKDDPMMKGQQWYPERVERYSKWQHEVDAGERPSATYKYFGDWLEKNNLQS